MRDVCRVCCWSRLLPSRFRSLLWGLALVLSTLLGGQSAWALDVPAAQPAVREAELAFLNRPIVRFRGRLLGATPEMRAARASANLQELLLRAEANSEVRIEPTELGNVVEIGGVMAFVLVPDDVDKLGGETFDQLTTKTVQRLRQVIGESREMLDSSKFLRAVAFSLAETVLLLLAAWSLLRIRRWLDDKLLPSVAQQASRLQLGGAALFRRDRILPVARWLLRTSQSLLLLALIYVWLSRVFAHFPYTRAWGERINGFFMSVALQIAEGMLDAVPNLLIAAMMFMIARGVVSMLRSLFDQFESGKVSGGWLDVDTVRPTRKIASIAVWLLAVVMAYPYLPGAQTEAFKGISVLVGLMVSLGASSVVGQAAGGMILMYSRVLRCGEYVRIGEYEGTVVALGMFTTRIRTGRGAEITLPNSTIVGSATTNYSRAVQGAGFVVDTKVTIGYDTPWRQVEALLLMAAQRTPGVLATPEPRVFQTALLDFYPEYWLVCQASPAEPRPRADVLSSLHANIQDVFNEYGVQIMSPNYLTDPQQPKLVPPADWYAAPAQPSTK